MEQAKVILNFRVTPSFFENLAVVADELNTTKSALARKALERYIGEQNPYRAVDEKLL